MYKKLLLSLVLMFSGAFALSAGESCPTEKAENASCCAEMTADMPAECCDGAKDMSCEEGECPEMAAMKEKKAAGCGEASACEEMKSECTEAAGKTMECTEKSCSES